jgi:hypothetical protein
MTKLEAPNCSVNTLNPGQKTDLAESSPVYSFDGSFALTD